MGDFRTVVAREGLTTNQGAWHLKAGSVLLPEDRVPIYIGGDWGYDALVGHASDFQRKNGAIDADIELKSRFGGVMEIARNGSFNEYYDVSIYGDRLETESHWSAKPIYVDFVRIRAVVIFPLAGIPKGMLNE